MKKMKLKILLTVVLFGNASLLQAMLIPKNSRLFIPRWGVARPAPRPPVSQPTMEGPSNKTLAPYQNEPVSYSNKFTAKKPSVWKVGQQRRSYTSSVSSVPPLAPPSSNYPKSWWANWKWTPQFKIEELLQKMRYHPFGASNEELNDLERLIRLTGYNPLNRKISGGRSFVGELTQDCLEGYKYPNRRVIAPDLLMRLYNLGARTQEGEKDVLLRLFNISLGDIDIKYDPNNPKNSSNLNKIGSCAEHILGIVSALNQFGFDKSETEFGLTTGEILKINGIDINLLQEVSDIYQTLNAPKEFILRFGKKTEAHGPVLSPINIYEAQAPFPILPGYTQEFIEYVDRMKRDNYLLRLLQKAGLLKNFSGNFRTESYEENIKFNARRTEQAKHAKDKLTELLGLSLTSSHEAIKKGYYAFAKTAHPDATGKQTGAGAEKFKEVSSAWKVYNDELKKETEVQKRQAEQRKQREQEMTE